MTVQDLCTELSRTRNLELDEVLRAANVVAPNTLGEALTETWLQDNIQALFEVLNTESMEDAMTGTAEANAFLAAFQKAAEAGRRPRVIRWAAVYSEVGRHVSAGGPLTVQLPNIGVRVDDPFVIDMQSRIR